MFSSSLVTRFNDVLMLQLILVVWFYDGFNVLRCSTVAGFKRRKGYCPGEDIATGSVMTLSQCSNTCLRDSSLAAFLFDFDTNKCKLLITLCKQTIIDSGRPNLYMYDQCKYSGCVGVNTNHPNLNQCE